jgi:hypothetical protein
VENLNDVFEEFAAYFAGGRDCDRPMAHSGLLKRDKLDYTVASLETVDKYLKYLHEHWRGQTGGEWDRAVLWGGAYVGEVIRRSAPRPYDWVAFDVFIRAFPTTTELLGSEKTLAVCALLTPGGAAFTLPIAKTLKFVVNGPEDSVHFYAFCEVRPPDTDDGMIVTA